MELFRRFDASCLYAFLLLYVSNILEFMQRTILRSGGYGAGGRHRSSTRDWFSYNDPSRLEEMFDTRSDHKGFDDAVSMLSALSLFALFVPIFQVSWILSRGGKRGITRHITIFILAMAGSLCEILSSLMMAGTRSMASFLSRDFELNDWGLSDNEDSDNGDGMGWKVLELSYMMNRGLTTWVNAFEWVCLSGIFTILFYDIIVLAKRQKESENEIRFTTAWAILGCNIGQLGWLEFISDILRTKNWRLFSKVSHVISIINLWLLLPTWLLMLGMKLPKMKESLENRRVNREDEALLAGDNALAATSTAVLS